MLFSTTFFTNSKYVKSHRWFLNMCCYFFFLIFLYLLLLYEQYFQYFHRFAYKSCLSQFSSVLSLSRVWLFETPWIPARQASLSIINSRRSPKAMSFESVMPSNHLILCRPLLLLPSIFSSIRVFSNESAVHIRRPKYWSFSFSPSNEYRVHLYYANTANCFQWAFEHHREFKIVVISILQNNYNQLHLPWYHCPGLPWWLRW